jgi:light-regulated signal transduction histidine kinase (bacteriophytochrome)
MTVPAPPLVSDTCASEPIHIPGSIQPHGVLLALHGPGLTVTQVAASCQELLGVAVEDLLGREVGALDPALARAVNEALVRYREFPDTSTSFDWTAPRGGRRFVGQVHESLPLVVLELELGLVPDAGLPEAVAGFARAARMVRNERDLEGKTQVAAAWIRRLTGHDRVLVYRFHEDLHGEVIAEARRADLESFLGLHYPASDIPAQARRLYLTSPTRVITDVNYAPSALVPALNPITGRPLDLSHSTLRSVSPVHLEYLRNMGVGASLTASLLRDGQLWGLISCHHDSPRSVPAALRTALDWMAQDLATQIALVEDSSRRNHSRHLADCRGKVLRAVEQGARLPSLVRAPALTDLLGLVGAEGVAVLIGSSVIAGGVTPDPDQILAIAEGLCAGALDAPGQVFATDSLGLSLPAFAHLAAVASGVVVLPFGAAQPLRLVWFRGEQRRLVQWGGNPDKAVDLAADGQLRPRRSFAAWVESVRGRSLRWQDEELDSVSSGP